MTTASVSCDLFIQVRDGVSEVSSNGMHKYEVVIHSSWCEITRNGDDEAAGLRIASASFLQYQICRIRNALLSSK